ncbi:MAG: IS21 family transposase [Proteobacteria bacterium]|nr:IS21 family transposase [Pseudomonadota bacterium]
MLNYETFCQIRDHLGRQQLTVAQTARALALDPRTVAKWANVEQFHPRAGVPRVGKLDAYKGQIVRWLDAHPYTAQQIFQRLREAGFEGGITIVKDYVHRIRPRHQAAFLKLDFAAGECAQVDWGEFGSIAVGSTRRRLSFFLMVLCYSRRMYLEFTTSQKMEFFLACHENAFAAFGGCPSRIMVDNLKSAVLQRLIGIAPVFNPKYLDFSRHWGFEISPCNVRSGNEKGRVENGVGYVKKNFLAGLELADFAAIQPAAALWVDTVANVRIHGATHRRPIDLFEEERAHLAPLNPAGFDLARVVTVRASKQFRVPLDTNHYSVPPRYAGQLLTLKAYADRVCIYDAEQLVARHPRSMDRRQDIEEPEHAKQLLVQRKSAREQRLLVQFLALSPRAQAYRDGLEAKRVNARVHLRKILALAELHGKEAVARAIDDGLELQAFSAEYIANILAARRRIDHEPAALQLTRRADLLDLELPEPDLSIYDRDEGNADANTP